VLPQDEPYCAEPHDIWLPDAQYTSTILSVARWKFQYPVLPQEEQYYAQPQHTTTATKSFFTREKLSAGGGSHGLLAR
jgi:hypothetical protein